MMDWKWELISACVSLALECIHGSIWLKTKDSQQTH